MKPTKETLLKIFDLQNQVIQKYISEFPGLYNFISRCYELINTQTPNTLWLKIPENRRKIFKYYEADTVSTLINAVRLALQGCETDAFALLRVVNQELGEFNSIIELSLYDQVYQEVKQNSSKLKSFSSGLQSKFKQTKDSDRSHMYGRLSNLGSHSSPTRLALSIRNDKGKQRIKVGMSIENPNVEGALLDIASHFLFAIRVFEEFFKSNLPSETKSHLSDELASLEKNYESL